MLSLLNNGFDICGMNQSKSINKFKKKKEKKQIKEKYSADHKPDPFLLS